jgi:hypothetical protein
VLFLKLLQLCDAECTLVGELVCVCTCTCADFIIFTLLSLVDYIYSYNSSSLIPSILLSRAAIPLHLGGTGSESQSGNIARTEVFNCFSDFNIYISGRHFKSLKHIFYYI